MLSQKKATRLTRECTIVGLFFGNNTPKTLFAELTMGHTQLMILPKSTQDSCPSSHKLAGGTIRLWLIA